MAGEANVSFREVQYMRQWWIWLIVLAYVAVIGLMLLLPHRPHLWPAIVVFIGMAALQLVDLFGARLITTVRDDGIYVERPAFAIGEHFLFHRSYRRIPFSIITFVQARTYNPLREYGGWGIIGIGKRRAYRVSGNRGVQLVFIDGGRLLIGSQKPDDLATAIDTAMKTAS